MPVTTDPYYLAEEVPTNLRALGVRLREHFKVPAINIGFKGDTAHLRGYHRSRAFLLNSPYATNRGYSVVEAGNGGGDPDWVSAIDISLPDRDLLPMCKRLDAAVRAGKLEKVSEWYGNLGGDTRVDGYDNIHNRVATSDRSHLWHCHMSFIRGRANDDHTDVFNVLAGITATTDTEEEDDMTPDTRVPVPKDIPQYLGTFVPTDAWLKHATYYHLLGVENTLKALNTSIADLTKVIQQMPKPSGSGPGADPQIFVRAALQELSAALASASHRTGT